MNWFEHEYLVPVIIGNERDSLNAAKVIYKATGIKPHLFAEKFSFFQRLGYNCHVVSPMRDVFLVERLASFAASLEEYYCPILVLSSENCRLVTNYSDVIESAYVVINLEEILNFGR